MTCGELHCYRHPYDGRVVICPNCQHPYSFTEVNVHGVELSHADGDWVYMRRRRPLSNLLTREMTMRIYTDGSCLSDRSGGWAWWNALNGASASGSAVDTTHQKMELEAAIQALRHYVDDDREIVIVSDSAYLVNCMQEKWYLNWLSNEWLTTKNKKVENRDYWSKLIELVTEHGNVHWEKVKGHSGDEGNDRADALASNAATLSQSLRGIKRDTTLFELYIEGHGMFNYIQWNQEVPLDWQRFETDDVYADLVSKHIAQSLEHLSREVEEIGIISPKAEV